MLISKNFPEKTPAELSPEKREPYAGSVFLYDEEKKGYNHKPFTLPVYN